MKKLSLLLCCLFASLSSVVAESLPVTPLPLACEYGEGAFRWDENTRIRVESASCDRQILSVAFAKSALPVQFAEGASASSAAISLSLVGQLPGIDSPEGYVLAVTPEKVSVQAVSDAGLFYGIQTLLQLAEAGQGRIKAVTITDEPRFPYRGIMLDVSRHFRTKEYVKKQIDLLARYKINRLHLHLTDAAGWRLQIEKYPRLTEFAAWRKGASWKEWWNGSRQYCEEGTPGAYGGYYTREDIRDLLEYARQRCVTIIPEIEMPSHSEEVLAAYPELSCTHEPYKQSDFCVGNEQTFEFLENVLSEVISLFPSEYIHIGGDEAGKAAWKTCPLCQERMKKEGLKDVDELQSYLIHRIEKFLNDHGRRLLGFDEILEGGLAPNATVMSWRGEQGGLDAVRSGHHAIMCPGEYCYLDGYQDAPYSQPEAIGGYLPLKKVYGYEPVPDSLTADETELMLGVQGNLWAEYIVTDEHMEHMLYPRAIAIAEVGWTAPANKSWDSFRERILSILPQMEKEGYHPFDFSKEIGNRKEALSPCPHLAKGKKVTFGLPYWKNYPANGALTLTDGVRGGWNYNDKRWLGFTGDNYMDAVIDMEQETEIHSVAADFMQICGPYVYFPSKVVISVSSDGKNYATLKEITHPTVKDDAVSFKAFGWEGHAKGRYIRYQAWPAGMNGEIMFVDEIIVK